jgi:hypothetical protein
MAARAVFWCCLARSSPIRDQTVRHEVDDLRLRRASPKLQPNPILDPIARVGDDRFSFAQALRDLHLDSAATAHLHGTEPHEPTVHRLRLQAHARRSISRIQMRLPCLPGPFRLSSRAQPYPLS